MRSQRSKRKIQISKPKMKLGETTKEWLKLIGALVGIHIILLLINTDFSKEEIEEPKYKEGDIVETNSNIIGFYTQRDLLIYEGTLPNQQLDWTDPHRTLTDGRYKIEWTGNADVSGDYHIEIRNIQLNEVSWINNDLLDRAMEEFE